MVHRPPPHPGRQMPYASTNQNPRILSAPLSASSLNHFLYVVSSNTLGVLLASIPPPPFPLFHETPCSHANPFFRKRKMLRWISLRLEQGATRVPLTLTLDVRLVVPSSPTSKARRATSPLRRPPRETISAFFVPIYILCIV